MNVPEPIERVCKWTINAEKVERSDETWGEVYHRQLRGCGLILAGLTALMYMGHEYSTLEWYHIVFVSVFGLYACLPTVGAYLYMGETGDG